MTELNSIITEIVHGKEINYILDETTGTYIPDLRLPEQKSLGRYGRMRAKYLKENHSGIYHSMILRGTLNSHCTEIEETATARIEIMIEGMAEADGLTEEMKNTDPLKWAGLMNNYKSCAEEIVLNELIYN